MTTDRGPGAEITVCPDGPLLVRGDFVVVDSAGNQVPLPRPTVALCRCGRSGDKPWCDASHKSGFSDR